MSVMRCVDCGESFTAKSRFDVDGACPECGCEELVEADAYDDEVPELRCAECGFEVEAGVRVEWDEESRIFGVDDDCPVCEAEGFPGQALEPADQATAIREEPEYGVAREAARQLRESTVGHGVPVDVEEIARRRGLALERGAFDHDGMLRGDTIEIPRSYTRSSGPERFLISHEIGHHELRHQGRREKIEPEANAFASELLIPREALTRAVNAGGTFTSLARHFNASRQAVANAVRTGKLLAKMRR